MLKFHRSLCRETHKLLWILRYMCMYHLFVWSNLDFLHNSQWITLPTQSCLVLYSFWVNMLHSLIMWLIVLSLSPHNLDLLFCCVLSILALIWSVLIALFCAAVRRDSVSLLMFPFLNHFPVFSHEMLFISRLKRPLNCFSPHFLLVIIIIIIIHSLELFLSALADSFSLESEWQQVSSSVQDYSQYSGRSQ